jgi:hypothetical protein
VSPHLRVPKGGFDRPNGAPATIFRLRDASGRSRGGSPRAAAACRVPPTRARGRSARPSHHFRDTAARLVGLEARRDDTDRGVRRLEPTENLRRPGDHVGACIQAAALASAVLRLAFLAFPERLPAGRTSGRHLGIATRLATGAIGVASAEALEVSCAVGRLARRGAVGLPALPACRAVVVVGRRIAGRADVKGTPGSGCRMPGARGGRRRRGMPAGQTWRLRYPGRFFSERSQRRT